MALRFTVAAVGMVLGLGVATSAVAMSQLQPGMLTMMQQGGVEHGVQSNCALPGYDPRRTCRDFDYPVEEPGFAANGDYGAPRGMRGPRR